HHGDVAEDVALGQMPPFLWLTLTPHPLLPRKRGDPTATGAVSEYSNLRPQSLSRAVPTTHPRALALSREPLRLLPQHPPVCTLKARRLARQSFCLTRAGAWHSRQCSGTESRTDSRWRQRHRCLLQYRPSPHATPSNPLFHSIAP